MLPSPSELKADYGIDAPGLMWGFCLGGLSGVISGLLIVRFSEVVPGYISGLAWSLFYMGLAFFLTSLAMLWGSRVGKLKLRDQIIAELHLQGHEQVLDVGCGRGLMLLGIAKQLTTGRAVGIDLWQTRDQSGKAITTTEENARRENVAERVELHTGDMRELPFGDGRFEVIVSTWAIHNVPDAAGRLSAIQEIHRVLKPGGRLVIVDIRYTHDYLAELSRLGMGTLLRRGPTFLFVIPSYTVVGTK
jgi:arsenite methyltransferase